jgi:phosphatidylglycerophosphatase A
MMQLPKITASCFGIGYIKGGGTVAAMVTCFAWWKAVVSGVTEETMIAATAAIIVIGIWAAYVVEKDWGKDSNRVVIDEAAGMCISLLFIPVSWPWILAALVLFRFFDIVKPLYIRKAESLPGGWGVMADDILAGVYTNLLLQLIVVIIAWQHL